MATYHHTNVAFAFRQFAQLHGLRINSTGVVEIGKRFELRRASGDRLVRPKALEDLDVTDTELSAVEMAVSWLNDSVALLLSEAQRKLQER